MSAVDEGLRRAQAQYIKLDQIDDRVKAVEAKVSEKIDENWTLTDVRFTGLENGEAGIYGEVNHIKDDVGYIHGEVCTLRGEVAHVADDVAMVKKLMVVCILLVVIMLGIIIIMLGYITYVQSLPVTVCPHHAEPVDECKNPTNTIIGGMRCLTDKILPKPCRNGFACKREVYPDW